MKINCDKKCYSCPKFPCRLILKNKMGIYRERMKKKLAKNFTPICDISDAINDLEMETKIHENIIKKERGVNYKAKDIWELVRIAKISQEYYMKGKEK